MSRDGFLGPKLPKTLLDQVQSVGGAHKRRYEASRKDRRKAERQQKKQPSNISKSRSRQRPPLQQSIDDGDSSSLEGHAATVTRKNFSPRARGDSPKPTKSILKKTRAPISAASDRPISPADSELSSDNDGSFTVSRQAAKAGLTDEDAKIAALQRKLGMRGKTGKASQHDDLDWLLAGSDSEVEEETRGAKRKRPEDAKWLRDKRLKSGGSTLPGNEEEGGWNLAEVEGVSESSQDDDSDDDQANDLSGGNDFAGFQPSGDDSDEDEPALAQPPLRRPRENPYIAPVATQGQPVTKYVPPALRQTVISDAEVLSRLQQQMQGQLNRLSEANLLSILSAVEKSYANNARQYVTATLVEMLVERVSDPSALNDTFHILHAGFAAALYKSVGTDFGTQLVEKVVEAFDGLRAKSSAEAKQCLNLLTFLGYLCTFQVVGSGLVFDYIRLLLDELTETNTELLLRVIRTSGSQLRQDDPSSLKDIALQIQRNVADAGEATLSVRTKYMLETIQNLKNNRMRTGAAGATLVAEHTTSMRKTLGSLQSTHSIKATEPLRITLSDVRDAEKKGKWWLVGASYNDSAKMATTAASTLSSKGLKHVQHNDDAAYDSETPGHVNLHRLARQQGMNTDVRRAIFIAIMSASDFKDAHVRLMKLRLKAKQELEVPRVLLQCVVAESGRAYNPYYALVARKLCKAEKRAGKAFQFQFFDVLRQMEGRDGEADEAEDVARKLGVKQAVAVAKFYAAVIADGGSSIAILKKVDFGFLQASQKMSVFAEVLLTSTFKQLWVASKKEYSTFEHAVGTVFGRASEASSMIEGLQSFLKTTVGRSGLAHGKEEAEMVAHGCTVAVDALTQASRSGQIDDEGSESE